MPTTEASAWFSTTFLDVRAFLIAGGPAAKSPGVQIVSLRKLGRSSFYDRRMEVRLSYFLPTALPVLLSMHQHDSVRSALGFCSW